MDRIKGLLAFDGIDHDRSTLCALGSLLTAVPPAIG
jgi:hypothetical protein